jgi:hypothetical protein
MADRKSVDWVAARPPAAAAGAGGLRERKKALMRQRLSDTATQMFLARGFDDVRVTEVAAACEVLRRIGPSTNLDMMIPSTPVKPEPAEPLLLSPWSTAAEAIRSRVGGSLSRPAS